MVIRAEQARGVRRSVLATLLFAGAFVFTDGFSVTPTIRSASLTNTFSWGGHQLRHSSPSHARRQLPANGLCMGRRDGFSDAPKGKRKQQDRTSAGGREGAVENTYNYVQGGFEEKTAPVAAGNQTSMYAAFDSALRASNYNMFCSPLKPVNAPTQFKSSSPNSKKGSASDLAKTKAQKWEEPAEEDPEELRQQMEAEYRELDRLIGADTRGANKEGSKPVIRKLRKKESKGTIIISENSQPVREVEEPEQEDEFQEQIQEGYEELQKLLALKPKGKTRHRVDSARFTGNMTQHRIDGAFKAITVKDPLSRVYATRLKDKSHPPVGSSEAVRRPGKPAEQGKRNPTAPKQDAAAEDEVVVGDVLAALRSKPQPPPQGGAAGTRQGAGGAARRKKKEAARKKGADAALAGLEQGGKKGTVVLNHSTNIDGLVDVLQRLTEIQGIQTVVPGRLSSSQGREPRLVLRVTAPTVDGFKCIARRGSQVQEVFVVCDLDIETLQAAVAWSL